MIGLEPGPFSLRQLVNMAAARGRALWEQTELLASVIAIAAPYVNETGKRGLLRAIRAAGPSSRRRQSAPAASGPKLSVEELAAEMMG